MTESCKKILNCDAFRALGEKRLSVLREFLDKESFSLQDAAAFASEISGWVDLSDKDRNELLNAFYKGLNKTEKRRIDCLIDIISAFS